MEGTSDAADQSDSWVPPKQWTAWPLRARDVPDASPLPRVRDEDDIFTARHPAPSRASTNLEEEIAASMLRLATVRIRGWDKAARRQEEGHFAEGAKVKDEDEDEDDEEEEGGAPDSEKGSDSDEAEESKSTSVKNKRPSSQGGETEWSCDSGQDEGGSASRGRSRRRRRSPSADFVAVPSADDELSYHLLRPTARRIMEKLDNVLVVLHNARANALGYRSETSTGEESASEGRASRAPPRRVSILSESSQGPKSKRARLDKGPESEKKHVGGRPKIEHAPLEGETEQEMLVRIARQQKKRIPRFYKGTDVSESEDKSRSSWSDSTRSSSRSSRGRSWKMAKLGLKDWRDVIGAAALAGFSPNVITRTTQRCANLFGGDMTIHTLPEIGLGGRQSSTKVTRKTTRFHHGAALPSDDELQPDDDDSDEFDRAIKRRMLSRQRSRSRLDMSTSDEEAPSLRTRSRTKSISKSPPRSRTRRRSATPGTSITPGGHYVCPEPGCHRHVEGFARRYNLVRHMDLMHGKTLASSPAPKAKPTMERAPVELDSEDEMDGGVHVDGFLQPIKMRKGWRGVDSVKRSKRTWRKREGVTKKTQAKYGYERKWGRSVPRELGSD